MNKSIVLGAGIAGLGCFEADNNLIVYEAKDSAGGLCSSFEIEGFRFDRAVHLSFTKEKTVRGIFDETPYYTYNPLPKSWYKDKWVKHPIQNNLYPLSPTEKVSAIKGFLERKDVEGDNFKEWSKSQYGDYMWDNFFEPYNKKYWCTDLETLDVSWVGNRFYKPTIDEVLLGSYTDETPNTYYAPEMRYPMEGGYYAFIKRIAEKAKSSGHLITNKKAVKINITSKTVFFEDGTSDNYDTLYSSIPLPEMVSFVEGNDDELPATYLLDNTGVVIVSFGLRKSNIRQMWFYIYDEDVYAARAYMPSVKSAANAPDGYESIQFEIYYHCKNDVPQENQCINNCIYALKKIGICDEKDIIFSDYRVLKYGNVIFKKGMVDQAQKAVNWFSKYNIKMIGRFGRWEYLWSDQAFMSGYIAVRENV